MVAIVTFSRLFDEEKIERIFLQIFRSDPCIETVSSTETTIVNKTWLFSLYLYAWDDSNLYVWNNLML